MKRIVLVAFLLAIAGLWTWALVTRDELEPLPERYCGTFQVFRFEPSPGVSTGNPLAAGQRQQYTFRRDGTYRITVLVSGGYEMIRSEGTATLDRKQVIALHRLSVNRRKSPAEPERFGTWWGQDEEGTFLLLRHVEKGHSLYLRRVEEKEAEPPG